MRHFDNRWYSAPEQDELGALFDWMDANLPPEGAVAADFVLGPAILAHTRHPMLLQPKYESRESRDRIEAFLTTLYRGTPADFHRLLGETWRARYLAIDLRMLWGMRYAAGIPVAVDRPPPGTAAERLLHSNPEVYGNVPGFALLYRSALPTGWLRFYRIEPSRPAR